MGDYSCQVLARVGGPTPTRLSFIAYYRKSHLTATANLVRSRGGRQRARRKLAQFDMDQQDDPGATCRVIVYRVVPGGVISFSLLSGDEA